jgi:hypothetical protein
LKRDKNQGAKVGNALEKKPMAIEFDLFGYLHIFKSSQSWFLPLNPENALENLFRVETTSNQRLRRLIFKKHNAAMLLENKALIYCILGSHNEVLMHYLG